MPAVPIVVIENLGGTANTVGWLMLTPNIKLWLELPPVGNTAAGAVALDPKGTGVIVIATGFEEVFKKPQKFTWSLPAGVIVTAVDEEPVTVIAVVGPTKRYELYVAILDSACR